MIIFGDDCVLYDLMCLRSYGNRYNVLALKIIVNAIALNVALSAAAKKTSDRLAERQSEAMNTS